MANRKISQLTALTTPAAGDYLPIVDISEAAAADQNKRITIEELLRGAPDGTEAAPSIAFESDPNTGIYSPGADQLAISTGGTGRLFVNANGNVGVGVASALKPLHVRAGSDENFYVESLGGSGAGVGLHAINDATNINVPLQFTASQHAFRIGATEAMRITSAGNVGIGTTSPGAKLDVAGNGLFVGASASTLTVGSSGTAGPHTVNIQGGGVSADYGYALFTNRVLYANTSTGGDLYINPLSSGSSIRFLANNGGTEHMRIDSAGYVRLAAGSGGIQFNGDTAAANALNDYEEGTWTPEFAPATGAFTSITYGQRAGVYTRVGNICYCHGNFQVSTVDTTGASGALRLSGLPFPISNAYGLVGSFGIAYKFVGTGDYLKIHGNNNNSYVVISDGTAVSGADATVQATEIQAGTYIRFSFTYKVA